MRILTSLPLEDQEPHIEQVLVASRDVAHDRESIPSKISGWNRAGVFQIENLITNGIMSTYVQHYSEAAQALKTSL
jgi:metal-dependent HD superfamily phosphatase/phosphodiesterase